MTKAATASSQRARRKELVTLSVITASALTLAGSWLGIAAADRAGAETVAAFQTPVQAASATLPALEASGAGSTLQPAPAPVRQVVVVRRSRAS